MGISILSFGTLEIYQDNQLIEGFISRKTEVLLIYLLCNPSSQEREWLANLLWDTGSHEAVLNNLSKSLTNIRDLMPNIIESSRNQIRVNRENICFDALEFETGLKQ